MDHAALYGHVDVFQYLYEHRSEGSSELIIKDAVQYRQRAAVQCLDEGYPVRVDLTQLLDTGDFYYYLNSWIADHIRKWELEAHDGKY